jgi:hypothetical protein
MERRGLGRKIRQRMLKEVAMLSMRLKMPRREGVRDDFGCGDMFLRRRNKITATSPSTDDATGGEDLLMSQQPKMELTEVLRTLLAMLGFRSLRC